MGSKITELVKELKEELEMAAAGVEDCSSQLEALEKHVAGNNAAVYRAVERLVRTAESALEEAVSWLEEIK